MKRSMALVWMLMVANAAQAVTVAIIDSGVDYKNEPLARRMWINPQEVEFNNEDDDGNGYQDDFYGYNFVHGNGEIINESYRNSFEREFFDFLTISARVQQGQGGPGDIVWLKRKLADPVFQFRLMSFGNYIHGTHVADIASRGQGQVSQVMALKIIPTSPLPIGEDEGDSENESEDRDQLTAFWRSFLQGKGPAQDQDKSRVQGPGDEDPNKMKLFKLGLQQLAQKQGEIYQQVSSFLQKHVVKVANGSFGYSPDQAKGLIEKTFPFVFGRPPLPEEHLELTSFFLQEMLGHAQNLINQNPHTLFVFAAGNDHNDNDLLATIPANVEAPNAMTVAASFAELGLASFSSYGAQKVHLAAPGVGITAAVPDGFQVPLSGTSQATPQVARVAARMMEANAKLAPYDVRRLLLGTVTPKDFLVGKVASGGLLHEERSLRAAELSREYSLDKSITLAFEAFPLRPSEGLIFESAPVALPSIPEGLVGPLPSPFVGL